MSQPLRIAVALALLACSAQGARVAPRALSPRALSIARSLSPSARTDGSAVLPAKLGERPRARVRAVASDGGGDMRAPSPFFSRPAVLSALVAYVYFVFISDFLPGPNALTLDPATWQEALALSTNFWLILPLTGSGPTLHPGLEAIFNFDLIWAALYAGFLVDGRQQQPSPLPFGRFLLGMQFLTAPVLLSYLALRSPAGQPVDAASLSPVERAAESRVLPALLGALGVGVLAWGCAARPEFGTDLATRTDSLLALLSADRLGASFVIDLGVFALCQGALVSDDLARRGAPRTAESARLATVCTVVPFFGLAYYLANRPALAPAPPPLPASSATPARRATPSPFSFGRSMDLAAPVRGYFAAWNERSMDLAASFCAEDVVYEDTLFPGKLVGRQALTAHLVKCADALPDSFRFALDDVAASGEFVGTRWHVELEDGTPLAFARGASMYRVKDGLITEGFDVPEPTLKSGSLSLAILSLVSRLGVFGRA